MMGNDLVTRSIDLHLFFMRIMKEHMLFIEVSFTPQNFGMKDTAMALEKQACEFLAKIISIANGRVSQDTLMANDIVTRYTLDAEKATSYYTGLPINTDLTNAEHNLAPKENRQIDHGINEIMVLNNEALQIVNNIISFKNTLIERISNCSIFTNNYPTLIVHITEEAKYYQRKIMELQAINQMPIMQQPIDEIIFWNHILSDHAEFIRGLLDPSEEQLMEMANMFAHTFDELNNDARRVINNVGALPEVILRSANEAQKMKEFKEQGTQGILSCKVKSVIIPLLADHVLREANHYLKLLRLFNV